jgi:hypothetical protein
MQRPSSASAFRSSSSSPEVIFLQSLDARARPGRCSAATASFPHHCIIDPPSLTRCAVLVQRAPMVT